MQERIITPFSVSERKCVDHSRQEKDVFVCFHGGYDLRDSRI